MRPWETVIIYCRIFKSLIVWCNIIPLSLSYFYRPFLPAYCLDFGNVILGKIVSRSVKTMNTGHFPICMKVMKSSMQQFGFFTNLNQVKNLPCLEEFEFEIKFDPRTANLNLGIVENFLLLNVRWSSVLSDIDLDYYRRLSMDQ